MKAIKKQITRKFRIPAEDILIKTTKDNTQRLAKAFEDVIITEDDGSQYSMSRTTFDKKYNIINTEEAISKLNEIDFIFNTTDKAIVFLSSWGEEITAFPGAAIVIEDNKFSYVIQEKEFKETYDIVNEKIQFDVFGNKHLVKKINESLKTPTQFRIEKLPLKNRYEFEIYDTAECDVTWIEINKNKE